MSKVRVLLFALLASVFVFSAAPAFAQQFHNGPYPTYRGPVYRGPVYNGGYYQHFGPRRFVGPEFRWGVGVELGFGNYGWDYDYGYGQGVCGLDYYGNPMPCLSGPIVVNPGMTMWFGPGYYGERYYPGFWGPREWGGHFGGGFREFRGGGGRVYGGGGRVYGGGGRVYGGGGRGGFRGGHR